MQNHKVHDLIIPIKSDVLYTRIMNEIYQIKNAKINELRRSLETGKVLRVAVE